MIKEIKIQNKKQLIKILEDIVVSARAKNIYADGYLVYENRIQTLITVLKVSK